MAKKATSETKAVKGTAKVNKASTVKEKLAVIEEATKEVNTDIDIVEEPKPVEVEKYYNVDMEKIKEVIDESSERLAERIEKEPEKLEEIVKEELKKMDNLSDALESIEKKVEASRTRYTTTWNGISYGGW